ncbi:hypothetical protein [Bdellovibrio sp. KM01]|uniref:hypothetical protein n=1 Tax=Bdellovibrio sp. KM01 TaxID=2748865 RepID=UPI0015EAE0F4|nr:hypothetical protein [Bdellovibrio sp. KM01]QLY26344.1 hypothetical protein HW988_04770 [Bdellovibrio sp. KM01]
MWLLLKLLFSAVTFAIRFSNRRIKIVADNKSMHDGIELFTNVMTNKSGTVQATSWNRVFPSKVIFKLTRESKMDRFFKNWGLADEIQTQDLTFDDLVYIASDSSSFMRKIQQDREARRLILELFNNGCEYIFGDGNLLRVHFRGDHRVDVNSANLLAALSKQLEEIQKQSKEFDPFFIKALMAEALIWGFAGYSLSSLLQWTTVHEDVYLNSNAMAKVALLFTGFLSLSLIFLILSVFKGSSRGHRIIIEGVLILAFSIPIGGIALFSDINIHMDRSASTTIEASVEGHYTQMHRRRRGRHYITYHIQISPTNPPQEFTLPLDIMISSGLYDQLQLGSKVRIEIGRGKLRQPWIRSIIAI